MGFIRSLGMLLSLGLAAAAGASCPQTLPPLQRLSSAPGQCTPESARAGDEALTGCLNVAMGAETEADGFEKAGESKEDLVEVKMGDGLVAVKAQQPSASKAAYSEAATIAASASEDLRACAGSADEAATAYLRADEMRRAFETQCAQSCQACSTSEAQGAGEKRNEMAKMVQNCNQRAAEMRTAQSDAERNAGREFTKVGDKDAAKEAPPVAQDASPDAQTQPQETQHAETDPGLKKNEKGQVIGPDGKPMSPKEAAAAERAARQAQIDAASKGRNDGKLTALPAEAYDQNGDGVRDMDANGLPKRPTTYGENETWRSPKGQETGMPTARTIKRTGYSSYDNSPPGDLSGTGSVWRRSTGKGGTSGVNNYGTGSLSDPLTAAAHPSSGYKTGDMIYDSQYGWLRVENSTSSKGVEANTIDYWMGAPLDANGSADRRAAWTPGFTGSTQVLHFPGGVVAPQYQNLGRNSPLPGQDKNRYGGN